MSLLDLFRQWPLVDADLHTEFGIDTYDRDLMTSRPWVWLRDRMLALGSADTRVARWAAARHKTRHPTEGR